jgi:hypothetical protein
MTSTPHLRRFLTRKAQAKRYSKSKKTIERWGKDPKMRMPPEFYFNGLPHRDEEHLERWEEERLRHETEP